MSDSASNCIERISLSEIFARYRIVIPEIQREYVWGDPSLGGEVLNSFLDDLLKHFQTYAELSKACADTANGILDVLKTKMDWNIGAVYPNDEMLGEFSRKLAESVQEKGKTQDVQPGFIYAYVPGYVNGVGSDRLTAFLIDGQQRVTTCFLVWLYLARRANSNCMKDFLKKIGHSVGNDDMAFSFRVRQLTHEFLLKLVDDVARSESCDYDFSTLEDRPWFLSEFRSDVSISNMVNALKTLDKKWKNLPNEAGLGNADLCCDFMASHVSMWLYVVNETVQGEQLYITMNGRGRSLSHAEIVKAKIFNEAVRENVDWGPRVGELFESIYDFFWRKRDVCLDVDEGVHKFLQWACILNYYSSGNKEKAQKLLQNKDPDGNSFKLGEDFFDVEKGGPKASFLSWFFAAIKSLDELVGDSTKLSRYFPKTAYKPISTDSERFQQDSFVVLPVLYWLMQKVKAVAVTHDDDWTSFPYSAPADCDQEIARVLHFLNAQCSRRDVQKAINAEVFRAVDLVSDFANQDKNWLAFVCEHKTTMILSEEEQSIARRLIEIKNQHDALEFEKTVWKIQDYRAERLNVDCRIDKFLGIKGDWRFQDWTQDVKKDYETALKNFMRFLRMREDERYALRTMIWLMQKGHLGYWQSGNDKLFPHANDYLFDTPHLVNAINELMSQIPEAGDCSELFDSLEKEFLKGNADEDMFGVAARALIASRLLLKPAARGYTPNLTKIQYSSKYYNHLAKDDKWATEGVSPVGGWYLWHTDRGTCRYRPASSCYSNLFACHKVFPEELATAIKTFVGEKDVTDDHAAKD